MLLAIFTDPGILPRKVVFEIFGEIPRDLLPTPDIIS